MKKITFKEYKSAIRAQYEARKGEDVTGILLNPTPAQLRNLCLMILDKGLNKTDDNTLRLFFNVKGEEPLRRSIENFDIGKFKPIISFLKGEKDSGNATRIELAAILVDFHTRPYAKYLQNGEKKESTASEVVVAMEEKKEAVMNDLGLEKVLALPIGINVHPKRKTAIGFAVFLSLFFMGYTVKTAFFPEKQCMQWQKDHYVAVDCASELSGNRPFIAAIPIDERLLALKKIQAGPKIIFFENGKPIVWYAKQDGLVELFNAPGFHPETGKPLKPITKYMIKKHHLNQ